MLKHQGCYIVLFFYNCHVDTRKWYPLEGFKNFMDDGEGKKGDELFFLHFAWFSSGKPLTLSLKFTKSSLGIY